MTLQFQADGFKKVSKAIVLEAGQKVVLQEALERGDDAWLNHDGSCRALANRVYGRFAILQSQVGNEKSA